MEVNHIDRKESAQTEEDVTTMGVPIEINKELKDLNYFPDQSQSWWSLSKHQWPFTRSHKNLEGSATENNQHEEVIK